MFADHFDFTHPLQWTVDGVLSEVECDALLERYREGPWLEATVNRAEGRAVDRTIRDNHLALVDDAALAGLLLERLRPALPERLMHMTLSGIKSRMRCYRYERGEHFGPHGDQSYAGGPGERSLLTLMVYLNDDFEGGRTAFLEPREQIIEPRRGRALLFQHMVLHEGRAVTRGTKYVLRTDVFYRDSPVAPRG
ncbi:MAG: 2OG-Fe(II) oxygenase [Myxococcales bacterium]|nr:2OG-Fe(II) oxygenase [Myxococcales bacterium]